MPPESGPGATSDESRRGQHSEQAILSENVEVDDRESIWTIPTRLKRWYFALFSIQIVIAAVVLVRSAAADGNAQGAEVFLTYTWQNMAPAAVASAAITLVIIDGINGLMVLSTWLAETLEKRRRREQERHRQEIEAAKELVRMEATAEIQKRWEEWNRRRLEAESVGEEFNEPPPGFGRETGDTQRK